MRPRLAPVPLFALAFALGCAAPPPRPTATAAAEPATGAPAASASAAEPSLSPEPAPVASAAPGASAAPSASAPQVAPPAPSAAAPARAGGKVTELGMHIGGGPNDEATKNRVRRSTTPLFPAFRACWAARAAGARAGHVGIDLRIPATGGTAETSHERGSVNDPAVVACIVEAIRGARFEAFGKPMVVSYSLKLEP